MKLTIEQRLNWLQDRLEFAKWNMDFHRVLAKGIEDNNLAQEMYSDAQKAVQKIYKQLGETVGS